MTPELIAHLVSSGHLCRQGRVPRFQDRRASERCVGSGQRSSCRLALQPGEQSQTITVTEAIPLVDTTNAPGWNSPAGNNQRSSLNGRNFMNSCNCVLVSPCISCGAWTQSTNGLRPSTTSTSSTYYRDGTLALRAPSIRSASRRCGNAVAIDTIQEFATQQNPKAEFGWKPGSITNVALSQYQRFPWHGQRVWPHRQLDATNNFLIGRKLPTEAR